MEIKKKTPPTAPSRCVFILRAHWGTPWPLRGTRVLVSGSLSQERTWVGCAPHPPRLSGVTFPSFAARLTAVMNRSDSIFAMTFRTLSRFLNKDLLVWLSQLFHTGALKTYAEREILTLGFQAKTLPEGRRLYGFWLKKKSKRTSFWPEAMKNRPKLCAAFAWIWNVFLCSLPGRWRSGFF